MSSAVAEHIALWWRRMERNAEVYPDDPDPRHLHGIRVHLRRIRSLESQLGRHLPDPPRAQVRDALGLIAARTGRLRDFDVLLACRREWLAALPPDLASGGEELWLHLGRERDRARELVAGYLAGDHFRGQRLALGRELPRLFGESEADLDARLVQAIRRRHRKLDRAARRDRPRDAEAWHRLRIQGKKLRYALEVRPAGKDRDRLLKALRRLQDDFGAFNDLVVQRQLLVRLAGQAWSPDALQAMGAWRLWLHAAQAEQLDGLAAGLGRFCCGRTRRLVDAVTAD